MTPPDPPDPNQDPGVLIHEGGPLTLSWIFRLCLLAICVATGGFFGSPWLAQVYSINECAAYRWAGRMDSSPAVCRPVPVLGTTTTPTFSAMTAGISSTGTVTYGMPCYELPLKPTEKKK